MKQCTEAVTACSRFKQHEFGGGLVAKLLAFLCILASQATVVASDATDKHDFFENRIRPVLIEHCYECHSADVEDIGGSLMLDSADAMRIGGDSGPAIEPGDAQASVLVSALRYESTEMPPDGKLPDHVIKDFEKWIEAGAADPRTGNRDPKLTSPAGIDLEAGRQHWGFQPLAPDSSLSQPTDESDERPLTPAVAIDRHIERKLQSNNVSPNQTASPEARLRRLAFDLTGLPPTTETQKAWLADPSPAHWAKLVDTFLDDQGFGEHWARHWMDVARYADSNGSDFNATFHEAWRYRDYLIRSFNQDASFDHMIRQQIAGDLMTASDDAQRRDNVIATTFLMLGTKQLSERDKPKLRMDVVDEQIDTVGRALMGLTLGCARCHDHKFDPVPTEDYYALAGIFRSTQSLKGESQQYVSTWQPTKLPISAKHESELAKHNVNVSDLSAKVKAAEKELKRLQSTSTSDLEGIVVDDKQAKKSGMWKQSTFFKKRINDSYVHDNNTNKGDASITYTVPIINAGRYEVRIAFSPGGNRAAKVPVEFVTTSGTERLYVDQRTADIDLIWKSLGKHEFAVGKTTLTIRNTGTSGYVVSDAVQFIAETTSAKQTTREADNSDAAIESTQAKLKAAKDKLARLKKNAPPPRPEAMAVSDRPASEIADAKVHIRGEVRNLGQTVPRGFLRVCSSDSVSIDADTLSQSAQSGRLQLADWLTDPDHPLVARVFVNRVWMHLMGEGIVRSVDNFGVQGERPTHPELLDHLAVEFIRNQWKLKPLVRQIVLTEAYQRSSAWNTNAATADPKNLLLWRSGRRRLPAEAVRDALVMIAGKLDRTPRFETMKSYGTLVSSNNADSKQASGVDAESCRSIYLPVIRSNVSPLMSALDVADPDLLVGRRPTTNVPGQALVLINSPLIDQWATTTAARVRENRDDFSARLTFAFELILQRKPEPADIELADQFFADDTNAPALWKDYIAGLFASTEFRLLD